MSPYVKQLQDIFDQEPEQAVKNKWNSLPRFSVKEFLEKHPDIKLDETLEIKYS